ncbi:hypothetical protein CIK05_01085 [Bdellovibrio sp. qaytius]|nr:hypothetical protein CIK05_01085 [Bdellovibrio sp. qaytius]
MNSNVTQFIKKLKNWNDEVTLLREILNSTKLEEDLKWNLPCYSYNDTNVVIIQPFKSYLGLMFFKGTLLKDPKKVLVANGPNSQSSNRFEFSSVAEIKKLAPTIKAYIKEAIANEASGLKVEVKQKAIPLPVELKKMFSTNAKLKKAFEALTPGRQRAYLFFFTSAKQSATRLSRIEKFVPKILQGKGMLD